MSMKLVTVPREPTDEMIKVLSKTIVDMFKIDDEFEHEAFVQAYRAMLRVGAKELPAREQPDDCPEGSQSISIGFNHCLDAIEHGHFGSGGGV